MRTYTLDKTDCMIPEDGHGSGYDYCYGYGSGYGYCES